MAGSYVVSVAIDNEENIWLANKKKYCWPCGNSVSKFDGANWTTYNASEELGISDVQTIVVENNGDIWYGGHGGVSKFDGANWTAYNEIDGLVHSGVQAIAIDNEGNKWFGTYGGVSKFDGTNWTTYTVDNGLATNNVAAIAIDINGDVWVGYGYYYGVSKFDGNNWTTYTTSDGLISNYVLTITIDNNGNKWIGTRNGVSKFDGTNWTSYGTSDGLAYSWVWSIVIDNSDNIWFGTGYYYGNTGGVSKFDGTNWASYTIANGLVSNKVYAIVIDNNGNKWIGTGTGLSKMTCEEPVVDFTNESNLCETNAIQFSNQSTKTDVFTKYEWDIDNNGTIDYTTKDIEHTFSSAGNYNVKLTASNSSCSATTTTNITVNPLPSNAGTISGNATVCQSESNITYTVPTITNADSYIWTLPTGATGTSTTNSIILSYGSEAVSGDIVVKGNNECGTGTSSSLPVTVKDAANPKIIKKWDNLLICMNVGDLINTYQWYNAGSSIPGATEQVFEASSSGTYSVQVTDVSDCSTMSDNAQVSNTKSVKVFPNPASKSSNLHIVNIYIGKLSISIYNNYSRMVKSFEIDKNTEIIDIDLPISGLKSGLYHVKIETKEGERITKKFIITE